MLSHILVAVDGSEHADRAVDFAAELARCARAAVTVVHAIPTTAVVPLILGSYADLEQVTADSRESLEASAAELVGQARERLEAAGVTTVTTRVEFGPPARIITDIAREIDADVIVMGRRGLGELRGLLLGSVSHKVSQVADATVVTVR